MTRSQKIVLKETGNVLLGEVICVAVLFGSYVLLDKFDISVLLGGILGAVLAAVNFFFMAVIAALAADRAQNQDVEGGRKLIKSAYPIRLLVLAALLLLLGKSGYFNIVALVLPLAFVRPIITIAEFWRKKGA